MVIQSADMDFFRVKSAAGKWRWWLPRLVELNVWYLEIETITRSWFQIFFIFIPTWGNDPI